MAWIDDRIWCHQKIVALTDREFRVWVNAIAYSAGMGTKGYLSKAQLKLIGSRQNVTDSLLISGLFEKFGDENVRIHDWEEHNGKRDARREQDRLRKRAERLKSAGQSAGQSRGRSAGQSYGQSRGRSAGTARVEGSEGSDNPISLRKFKCPHDGIAFATQDRLAEHLRNVHDQEAA